MIKESFSDLKWRLLIHSGVLSVSGLLLYTAPLLIPKIIILLIVLAIVVVANMEFCHLLNQKGVQPSLWLSLSFAGIWVLLDYASVMQYDVFGAQVLVGFLFLLITILFQFREIEDAIKIVGAQILGQVYLTLPIPLLLNILYIDQTGFQNDGRVWIAFLICVAKSADIGGYFIGKLFGKHRLSPQISPKKTVEGFIGGLLCSCILSLVFYGFTYILPKAIFFIEWYEALGLGLGLSIVSQLGDLTESLFKRDARVKDSSSIPAIGGVLDVMDSLIFTTPLLLAYLKLMK